MEESFCPLFEIDKLRCVRRYANGGCFCPLFEIVVGNLIHAGLQQLLCFCPLFEIGKRWIVSWSSASARFLSSI